MQNRNKFWVLRFLESEAMKWSTFCWTSCMPRRHTQSSNGQCIFIRRSLNICRPFSPCWSRSRRGEVPNHSEVREETSRADTNVSPIPRSNCLVLTVLLLSSQHIGIDSTNKNCPGEDYGADRCY